jgi:IS5 family transposase
MSYQRFVGLEDSSQIPDRTTVWEFRERLAAAGAETVVFDAVDKELKRQGYIARSGQMVDASLVPAPKQHFNKDEKALVEQDAMPIEWTPAQRRQKDLEASWTKKHGKSYYGYKLTVNADKRYKLIRKLKVTTASEHDTLHLEDVLDDGNTCRDLYADKGYVDGAREARLQQTGLRTHIQRKAAKGKPLSDCQKRRNTRIARSRARVEHVFAGLRHLGGNGVRTVGLARATLQLNLKAAAYNIRRLCSLKTCGIRPAFA